jgi:hypothetical protein
MLRLKGGYSLVTLLLQTLSVGLLCTQKKVAPLSHIHNNFSSCWPWLYILLYIIILLLLTWTIPRRGRNSFLETLQSPVFLNLFRSPGIDSLGGPVRQPYLSYRLARRYWLAESVPRNRFLGSLNVYKYGLWIIAGIKSFSILTSITQSRLNVKVALFGTGFM